MVRRTGSGQAGREDELKVELNCMPVEETWAPALGPERFFQSLNWIRRELPGFLMLVRATFLLDVPEELRRGVLRRSTPR